MFKTINRISLLLIIIAAAMSYWCWVNLPDLARYPVHWNAQGTPNRFGSKQEVLFILCIMPVTALMLHLLFWGLPKIEPLRDNLLKSMGAYKVIWMSTILLMIGAHIFIAQSYREMDGQGNITESIDSVLTLGVIGMAVFFMVIGNVLSKVRRNFMVGVRTPWTLTSALTWDATHRLTARLWVGAGLITLLSLFFTTPEIALFILIGAMGVGTIIPLIYSYLYWRTAPDRLS